MHYSKSDINSKFRITRVIVSSLFNAGKVKISGNLLKKITLSKRR